MITLARKYPLWHKDAKYILFSTGRQVHFNDLAPKINTYKIP